VSSSSGGELFFALYVRDALGLPSTSPEPVPPLEPAVERLSVALPVDRSTAALRWDRWWDRLVGARVAAPDARVPPAGLPDAFGDLTARLRRDSSRWSREQWAEQRRRGEPDTRDVFPVQEAVDRVSRELGRDRLLFDLSVEEVPVRGFLWRRLGPRTVLASTTMLRSPRVVAELRAMIRELVDGGTG